MALPEPSYIDRDPAVILAQVVARYESDPRGGKLSPASVQRLLIDIIVYQEVLLRVGIQEAAKQNTWRYARYPMIDLLAEILGPEAGRLPAQKAVTTLRYTISATQLSDVPIPAGYRARSLDNKVTFETLEDARIQTGALTVDVDAKATVFGSLANGYVAGQITQLVDKLTVNATVTNLTTTTEGADEEATEAMRARLPDAVALQAAAGPEDSYRAHAMAVHPDIIDVRVTSPEPPVVVLTVLTKNGLPSTDLLTAIEDAVGAEKVRPINDQVSAEAPAEVTYTIDVSLVLYKGEDEALAIAEARTALEAFALERRSGLGRSPADAQIKENVRKASARVFDVIVNAPSPPTVVGATVWGHSTSIAVDVDSQVSESRPTL